DESGWEVVYTDGACQKNGMLDARAGLGVWWGRDDPRNLSERVPGPQTNNRAELIAIIRALETAPMSDRPLLIKTDSCYVISCVRDWLSIWKANNFRTSTGSEVKNWKVILYLQHLMDLRFVEARGAHIQHVKAHVGHEGNEGADVLAKKGVWERRVKERDWLSTVEIPESSQGHYQVQVSIVLVDFMWRC
ncbi:ribonuclease H-like protein, partial [Sistotremastrum niveocremeum HHB9708]